MKSAVILRPYLDIRIVSRIILDAQYCEQGLFHLTSSTLALFFSCVSSEMEPAAIRQRL